MLEQYEDNENAIRIFDVHRTLLISCRNESIETAFAKHLHLIATPKERNLDIIQEELQRLTKPSDMPRAVALHQSALELVSRDKQLELWSGLHLNLAGRLYQNPLGEQAENAEQAIRHYKLALEGYTLQDFPELCVAYRSQRGVLV